MAQLKKPTGGMFGNVIDLANSGYYGAPQGSAPASQDTSYTGAPDVSLDGSATKVSSGPLDNAKDANGQTTFYAPPAPNTPWQDLYTKYLGDRSADPSQGSLSNLLPILNAGGSNWQPVDHYGSPSADKATLDGQMYDFGSGLDKWDPATSKWFEHPMLMGADSGAGSPAADAGTGYNPFPPGYAQPATPNPSLSYESLFGGGNMSDLQKAFESSLTGKVNGSDALTKAYESQLQGALSGDPLNKSFESIRENIDRGRKASTAQLRASLADRGLLSEPGHPQGSEISGLGRIEENIAPVFAGAIRDAATTGQSNALNAATSYLNNQNPTGTAAGYLNNQNQLKAQIALGSLDQNRQWNQFLASYGLQRDQVLAALQNGNIGFITALLDAYQNTINAGANGQVA